MEDLFLAIADSWNSGFDVDMSNSSLTYDNMIEDSIAKMSDFFDMGTSSLIESDNMMTVGVDDLNINSDDNLFGSRAELESMGITGQDALELMMTYAGTQSSLQGMDTGFNSYQQELCCDYMAGIRAELNDIDMSQVESYLTGDDYTAGINGKSRFDAIAEGMAFAHDYMDSHSDSPKFIDCFEQFKESQANSSAGIAELMDEQYGVECTMQHYKDLLSNGSDGFSSVEEYEDAIRKYFAASAEHAQLSSQISFKSRESMVPYENNPCYDTYHPERNPFGVYIMYHSNGAHPVETFQKPYLPDDFLDRPAKEGTKLLQDACNILCDAAGCRHIKVFLTDSTIMTNNAAHHMGVCPFTLIDDTLYLNRDYARDCLKEFGSTDILLCIMAHEIGHAEIALHCGFLDKKSNETLADMFSSILVSKMGIDIDVLRQWNLWNYDGDGSHDYKPSEGRWDIVSAGKYWSQLTTLDSFVNALEDKHFRELVYNYNADSVETVNTMAQNELDYQINEAGGSKEKLINAFDHILKFLSLFVTRI